MTKMMVIEFVANTDTDDDNNNNNNDTTIYKAP